MHIHRDLDVVLKLVLLHRLEPPEMNTNQLLLVSTMGLGVNLFGMFAMGGHHHHVCRFLCRAAAS